MPEEILPPSDAEFDAAPTVAHVAPPTDAEFNAAPEAKAPRTHFLDLPPDVQSAFAKSDPVATENDIRASWSRQDPQWKDPETQAKAAQVWKQLKAESPGAIETVGNLAKHPVDTAGKVLGATGGFLKGVFKQGKTYLEAGGRALLRPVIEEITGTDILSPERRAEMQRQIAENWAGTEESATSLMQGAATAGKKVMELTGQSASPKDYSPETAHADMMNDLAMQTQKEKISHGHGEFLSNPAVGKNVVEDLEAQGKPIRPAEVESRAAGDPLALAAFGGGMKGAGTLAKAVTPEIVGKAGTALLGDLGDISKNAAGKVVQGAGKAIEVGGKTMNKAAKVAPFVGGLVGLGKSIASGDISSVLGPYFAGRIAGRAGNLIGTQISRGGKALASVGEDIASNAPANSALGQLGRDVAEKLPEAAAKTAEGATFDVAFNQATEELPAEKEQPLQIGTGLGAVGALKGLTKNAVSGQLIAPRNTGAVAPVPPTRPYGGLSTAHNNAYANATPASKAFVNTARQLLSSVGAKADVFLAGPETDAELAKMGVGDQMREQIASNRAVTLRTKDGHSVVILNNPSDAPHEAMHALDHAAGPEATDALNAAVRESYSPEEFNTILKHQSEILGGDGANVWEKILSATGAGNDAAKAKLRDHMALADYTTKGEQIKPEDLDRAVDQIWAEHAKDNPQAYKDFLNDHEIRGAAEGYVASEIRAENFDALVKHTGPSLEEPRGIIPASARAIGKAMSAAGINPIEGRASEGQQYPLKKETVDQQREAVQAIQPKPVEKPMIEAEVAPKEAAPTSEKDAEAARKFINEVPDQPAVNGGESQHAILGKVADAIASKVGVAIQHSGAPDEPAASITSDRTQRRAIIEAYRNTPPNVRAMWPKTFFPSKVVRRGNGIQVQGWAPEVFSANAQKMAEFFAKAGPEHSPYEVDTNAKSLSEQGWKDFFKDVTEVAIPNYLAGRTASGVELQFPTDLLQRRGWHKPEIKGGAGKLDQKKADFINMAFGFRTPDTARISSGRLPQNIAAQEISRATIPGRVEDTVTPRPKFEGPKAAALGIEGESIREVNPLVNRVAAIARESRVAAPSLIEAWQNLNLSNIKSVEAAPEQPKLTPNTAAVIAGFQPATEETVRPKEKIVPREIVKRLMDMSPQEFADWTQTPEYLDMGGITGIAREIGRQSRETDKGLAAELRQMREEHSALIKDALAKKDFTTGVPLSTRGQFLRESAEAVENSGSMKDSNRPGAFQFQPSKNERAIKAAAVKRPDGKVFEGSAHYHAYDNAAKEPGHEDTQFLNYKEGFTTNNGEFLSRDQALERAIEQNQVDKKSYQEGVRTTFDERDKRQDQAVKMLETMHFNEHRKFQPNPEAKKNAEDYMKSVGKEYSAPKDYAPLDEKLGARVADIFDRAQHSPDDPKVKASYDALKKETEAQYDFLKKQGVKFEPWTEAGQPYANSKEMAADVSDNKHLFYFPSESGFGHDVHTTTHPLMEKTTDGIPYNDLFRAVHDYFGHAVNGYEFGPRGEYNAYLAHSKMYSAEANPALAAETMGQNSWVNFGKHLRGDRGQIPKKGEEGFVPPQDRPFAEQKAFNLQFQGKDKDLKFQKTTAHAPSKAWILPDGSVAQIGAKWHHEWMNENPKLGMKNTKSGEDNRVEAITKGFGRVNLEPANGRLTVEVRESDWRKFRPVVEKLIEKNLGSIDKIRVNLLSDKAAPRETLEGDIFNADDKLEAASSILRGEELPEKEKFDWMTAKFQPKSQGDLFGVKTALSTRELGDMTKAELKEHFPEAIVPGKEETIESDIIGSPLARQNKKDPHQAFADKLVEFSNSVKDTPEFQDGKQWYSEFTPMLKKEFGPDAPLMAQLLAATSPRVNPTVNYAFALDALEGFKSGRFSKIIPKFEEGMEKLSDGTWEESAKTPAEFMANWIEEHNLQPRQSNGQLYGMRSNAVLQVLAGIWMEKNKGPKVNQFVQNLLGTNNEATIDVWADRTMRRLGYEGLKGRWRILPGNQAGVTDADFAFSQEAFNRAAKKLKMKPSDLQGALWFAEKRLWADRGWGRMDLGDFRKEREKTDLLRAGVKQRETVQAAKAGQKTEKQLELEP